MVAPQRRGGVREGKGRSEPFSMVAIVAGAYLGIAPIGRGELTLSWCSSTLQGDALSFLMPLLDRGGGPCYDSSEAVLDCSTKKHFNLEAHKPSRLVCSSCSCRA
jgi:hypothetical protein